ncbi:MAG: hypothetical protein ACK4JY_03805 [Brevundimonas sp.]
MTFKLTRGETFSLALEELDLADLTGATCRADLKLSRNGGAPGDEAPVAAAFTVVPSTETVPGGGAGFILTIDAALTEDLAIGNYVVDARIALPSGHVEIADLQKVTVQERVTV